MFIHIFWPGLPYALNQAGLPFGVLLLIAVAFITGGYIESVIVKMETWIFQVKVMTLCLHFMADYSIILLIKGGNRSGTNSYQSLVRSTFGFPGFLILSGLQFLYPFIGKLFNVCMKLNIIPWCSILCVICVWQIIVFYLSYSFCYFCCFPFDFGSVLIILQINMNHRIMPHLCFLPQLWLATTSQPVTHWPKYFREYQEVC